MVKNSKREKEVFSLGIVQSCCSISTRQDEFLRVLPASFVECIGSNDDAGKLSRLFNNFGIDSYPGVTIRDCNNVFIKLEESYTASECSFDDSTLLKTMQSNLRSLFAVKGYSGDIDSHINLEYALTKLKKLADEKRANKCRMIDRLKAADKQTALLSMMLIALTWRVWEKGQSQQNDERASKLSSWIIPGDPSDTGFAQNPDWNKIGYTHDSFNAAAQKLLSDAEADWRGNNYRACLNDCINILEYEDLHISDRILGKAYYLIVKCCNDHGCNYGYGYDAAEFKRRAIGYGCPEAIAEFSLGEMGSLLFVPPHSNKKAAPDEFIICNKSNLCSAAFTLSAPKDIINDRIVIAEDSKQLERALTASMNNGAPPKTEILLCDDDLHRNFKELLLTLSIYNGISGFNGSKAEPICTIYIRCSESYNSLIDTAVKQTAKLPVRVIAVDEHKSAAQQLLGLHPMFYPIRNLDSEFLNETRTTLNVVIVSDNSSDLNKWLIREAYWLGSFNYAKVNLRITLISPTASETAENLKGLFPGMFESRVEDVSSVDINPIDLSDIHSNKLDEHIKNLRRAGSFFYFIVNCENSVEGLETARLLREWSLRSATHNAVSTRKEIVMQDLPVVAFYCDDDDVANLTDNLSIQGAEHGDAWYNDWRLIPFGMKSYLYGYDTIDGGRINRLAEYIHMQYCGIADDSSADDVEKTLNGFYESLYDRDSSMAVAISFPYRLFHVEENRKSSKDKFAHLLPMGWNIRNPGAYMNERELKRMNELLCSALTRKDLVDRLTNYEHGRWVRYMASRGWVTSTPDEALLHMKNGVPKHQLFAARMHPCICSVKELAQLEQKLALELNDARAEKYKKANTLIKIDRSSIESTAWIIRQAWLQDMVKADDDKEFE
ncbi:MAG: hypothetical protein IKI64_08835 [Clostridia bacterium]|nr:hypothetical protein [Clostridia bacterium]